MILAAVFFWIGVLCGLKALFHIARLGFGGTDVEQRAERKRLLIALEALLLSIFIAAPAKVAGGIAVPIVWPVLAVQIWLSLVCALVAISALVKLWLHRAPREPVGPKLFQVGTWSLLAGLCWLLPRANPKPIEFLTGRINLSIPALLAVIALAVVTVFSIVLAQRSAKTKRFVTAFASQIGLMAGVVVFGLPFLFLLVTSFKEDQDMSSANGIVWTPRVVQTAQVTDEEHPYYEALYKGVRVEADLARKNPDGTLSLTIARPVFYGGYSFVVPASDAKQIPRDMPLVTGNLNGTEIEGVVFRMYPDGSQEVEVRTPASMKGQHHKFKPNETKEVRPISLRWKNYVEALEFLPPEAHYGLTYLRNTLWLVVMNVLGAVISSSLVAYAFARLRFPGKQVLFTIMLSTMMLPAAVTLLPQFLIFRQFGWINTLKPLWVTSWFAGAFNVFLLRQFFEQIPYELEDASKIDGCSYLRSLWSVMLPQVRPALAVIAIMTFLGAWNNFMGPLVYSSSPETLPISYAVQLFNGERNTDPGLLMAFVTMSLAPVILLFAFAQRFFIEGVTLSGLGGR